MSADAWFPSVANHISILTGRLCAIGVELEGRARILWSSPRSGVSVSWTGEWNAVPRRPLPPHGDRQNVEKIRTVNRPYGALEMHRARGVRSTGTAGPITARILCVRARLRRGRDCRTRF